MGGSSCYPNHFKGCVCMEDLGEIVYCLFELLFIKFVPEKIVLLYQNSNKQRQMVMDVIVRCMLIIVTIAVFVFIVTLGCLLFDHLGIPWYV